MDVLETLLLIHVIHTEAIREVCARLSLKRVRVTASQLVCLLPTAFYERLVWSCKKSVESLSRKGLQGCYPATCNVTSEGFRCSASIFLRRAFASLLSFSDRRQSACRRYKNLSVRTETRVQSLLFRPCGDGRWRCNGVALENGQHVSTSDGGEV